MARYTLRRMQRMARWGGLGLWLWSAETEAWGAPGFVWLEDGQVVGNISLRRAASSGGWMIGNVAVRADRRGRGIGQALVETAIKSAAQRGGAWVGLEVREDNGPARELYGRLGFEPVGTMLELARPAGLPWSEPAPFSLPLRRARADDSVLLYHLAQEGLERPHREILEIRRSSYRSGWEARAGMWLEGCREDWWVTEEQGRVVGALRVSSRRPGRFHRVEVLSRQERLDDLGPRLVLAGVRFLSQRQRWEAATLLPGLRQRLEQSFARAGFRRMRRLVQMRLLLGRQIPATA